MAKSDDVLDIIYLEIDEHFYKQMTLADYLKKNKLTLLQWKVLFFRLLHVLSVIQEKYPTFRHNELRPELIYVYKKKISTLKKKTYTFKNKTFHVPNVGIDIKLANFDKTYIEKFVDNLSIKDTFKKNTLSSLQSL